jgi:hypothetical protein
MSRSYRSQKRSVLAARRIIRDSAGRPKLPRIIERRPFPGDSHPISKTFLRNTLRHLPIEYLYGLKRIELLPRTSAEVGDPYACYLNDEKAIRIYSLPMVWTWEDSLTGIFHQSDMQHRFGAEATRQGEGVTIKWSDYQRREIWFFVYILMHELGHHFRNQYPGMTKRVGPEYEEFIADIHSERYFKNVFRKYGIKSDTPQKSPVQMPTVGSYRTKRFWFRP